MMEVLLLGWEAVNYNKKGTEQKVEGLNLYVAGPNPKVVGLASDDMWVNKLTNPKLYDKVTSWALEKPMKVSLVQETVIGSRYPVLTDVVPLDVTKDAQK